MAQPLHQHTLAHLLQPKYQTPQHQHQQQHHPPQQQQQYQNSPPLPPSPSQAQQRNGSFMSEPNGNQQRALPTVILCLTPTNATFDKKQLTIPYAPDVIRIGRQTNVKTVPTASNGFFDSKVLSRQHAEIWATPDGRIWIKDIKSSNGTFVNGNRLSAEGAESDPHELLAQDILVLGIDIMSDDQRTIQHHKVSAKIDYAGPPGPNMSIVDMSLGDIDPTSNVGALPLHLSQPLQPVRGRSNSSSSVSSTKTVQNNQPSIQGPMQQRHSNYWSSPLSIEQVVKCIAVETKLAKQHSQDLSITQDFINNLLSVGNHGKSNHNKPQDKLVSSPEKAPPLSMRGINGWPKMALPKSERYSEPPAPPPSVPLPDRPRLTRSSTTELLPPVPGGKGSLRRRYSDRTSPSPSPSPTGSPRNDASHVKSLIDALTMKDEKVKKLELMLLQEREARENAEKRANTFEESADTVDKTAPNGLALQDVDTAGDNKENGGIESDGKDNKTRGLENRLQKLLVDMEDMKKAVAHYQNAAKSASSNADDTRKTLERVVQGMQDEKAAAQITAEAKDHNAGDKEEITTKAPTAEQQHQQHKTDSASDAVSNPATNNNSATTVQRSPRSPDACEAEPTSGQSSAPSMSEKLPASRPSSSSPSVKQHTTEDPDGHVLEHAAPYASLLTVVMFGVGLMAYLNGWPRVDK